MKLHQVTLPATDLDQSVAFYLKLGLRLIVHAPPRYARLETAEGETLSLHLVSADRPADPEWSAVIYFEVADVDARCRELMDRGVDFESLPRDERWLWREARLRDPAGTPFGSSTPGRTVDFRRGDSRATGKGCDRPRADGRSGPCRDHGLSRSSRSASSSAITS